MTEYAHRAHSVVFFSNLVRKKHTKKRKMFAGRANDKAPAQAAVKASSPQRVHVYMPSPCLPSV